MSISRLLNFPITLITRAPDGEDSWGSPTFTEMRKDTVCYYQQTSTDDSDSDGTVVWETLDIFLDPSEALGSYDAIEIALGGAAEEYEVVGNPSPVLNARTGKVNHIKLGVRRAVA